MHSDQDHQATVSSLLWKKFPIGTDGYVCLSDTMGSDRGIVNAARLSYGRESHTERVRETMDKMFPQGGSAPYREKDGKTALTTEEWAQVHERVNTDDAGLLRYLMRNRHSTPFEMAELQFMVRVPMDTWRQWIRHRTANVNEYSTRYAEAIDSMAKTPADQWRLQSTTNKQGSGGNLTEWPETYAPFPEPGCPGLIGRVNSSGKEVMVGSPETSPGEFLSDEEMKFHDAAMELYKTRLDLGVAREQARKDLPLSTYTEAMWKIDLHNLFHFLGLRMDSHAQKEIREYATVIGEEIVKPLFPVAWQAFVDYRLEAMTLSRMDIEFIQKLSAEANMNGNAAERLAEKIFANKRERQEAMGKALRLKLIYEPGV